MRLAEIKELEHIDGALATIFKEMSELSKKRPNDAVNLFKLGLINETVRRANALLGDQYRTLAGFTEFDSETAPTNSDVSFVIAQYRSAIEHLRSDNIRQDYSRWKYIVSDQDITIWTRPPHRLESK